MTVLPVDASLAGTWTGTERMCKRRRREIQFSLLSFITPFLVCPQGVLRGADLGPGTKSSNPTLCHQKKKNLPQNAHLKRLTPLYKNSPSPHPHTHMHTRCLTPDSLYRLILRIPTIPRYLSWLFPTWRTCCLSGTWPHSTPISWVPAFDFHCGLGWPANDAAWARWL